MYALVIGRAYPDEKTGMMGIFEFEQAAAISNIGIKTVYSFCDTRSIKLLRKLNYTSFQKGNVSVYGYHLPIGGIPRPIFEKLKNSHFKKVLKRIINDHGTPDIIHIHYPLLNLTDGIWEMLKKLNRPIIVTEHWSKVQTKSIEYYRCDLLKKIVNESDTFMCVGNLLKKSVIELTNTKKEIHVMPNMVNPTFYLEEKLQENNHFDFISIGRLVADKRMSFVIDAFSRAFSENSNIKLHIVGDGPLFDKLKQQINKLNMNGRVTLHGFLSREETANLIRSSDAFVSASILETFGVPFIESMACGKPVIGIKNGPIDNYINDTNGVLFEKDNLNSLTESLKRMYNYRNKYNGLHISKKAKEFFSERAIVGKLVDIYDSQLQKHGETSR